MYVCFTPHCLKYFINILLNHQLYGFMIHSFVIKTLHNEVNKNQYPLFNIFEDGSDTTRA